MDEILLRNSGNRNRRLFAWILEPFRFLRFAFTNLITKEAIYAIVSLLALWELLPRLGLLPPSLVPPASQCAVALVHMLGSSNLLEHILSSLGTLLVGLGAASVLGVGLGVVSGWQPSIQRLLLPVVQILASVPPTAFAPMAMIFFGVEGTMRVFLVGVGAVFPIFLNTFQAIKDTDLRYVQSARVFGASELDILFNVHVRQAIGPILMSVRTGIGLGLVMMTVAEMYGANSGVGFLLMRAKAFFRIPEMVVCMVALGLIGWTLSELMKYVELKAAPWKSAGIDD